MTARLTALLVAGLLASACAAGDNPEGDATAADSTAADMAAIDQIRLDYVTHYNAHHPSVVAELFTDSAFGLYADGTVAMYKPAILAGLEAEMAASPTASIETGEILVFGENGVGRGTYSVTFTPPGAPAAITLAGNYIVHHKKVNGTWKLNGVITNFNAPPPEGTMQPPDTAPPPPDEGTMAALGTAFSNALAAGDWAAVAALYTEDASVGFTESPAIQGRAAIQARFTERFAGATNQKIEIHDVGTLDFGNGWALDGGWFSVTFKAPAPGGNMVQNGTYMNLLRQQPDGSWKIHWGISNGQAKPAA